MMTTSYELDQTKNYIDSHMRRYVPRTGRLHYAAKQWKTGHPMVFAGENPL